MNFQEKECQSCLERFIDGTLKPADHEHMKKCEFCSTSTKVLAAGNALKTDILSSGEERLVKKIAEKVILNRRYNLKKSPLKWFYSLFSLNPGYALAVCMVVVMAIFLWTGSRDIVSEADRVNPQSEFSLNDSSGNIFLRRFGSRVVVTDNHSSIVQYDDRIRLEIAGGSDVIINRNDINMKSGSVLVSVKPSSGAFSVLTRHGSVNVIGTQFLCTTSMDETVVEVRKGAVEIVGRDGRKSRIIAGQNGKISGQDSQNGSRAPVSTEF